MDGCAEIKGWCVMSLHDGVTHLYVFETEDEARLGVEKLKAAFQVVRAVMPAEELLEKVFGKEGDEWGKQRK